MTQLSKRISIVTGAGIGIGQATAKALAARGDHVVVTDILEQKGTETAQAIVAAGGSAEFALYDVRSTQATDALVADIEARHGGIDVIVANAGIAHRTALSDITDEKWDLTFDIDLKGIFRLVRAAAPSMRARKSGSIVALSSIMGVAYGWDEHVHYSAAKSGVIGLVRGLAVELARDGVRVNGIAPGYIRTAQLLSEENSLGPAGAEKAAEFIPMGRLGTPEDIADVITFLASDNARYMTGQTLVVDGGLLVGRY
ncbi:MULTISPECIES: SDR family NAD(P)-dependent oxidoreductase [Rhizobium]|uniref:SDR family NAD(P)-dependent oxidoreductase n=1 Tax=Rhizobium TaxID=379 RepID=UPI000A1FC74E|nr:MULTISPECIES: SDR family NAD(P)-dependent oxidoreductase [Rhizobium]ARM90915.1 3-oxoacyl-(acyl-carrier-protein) reductase 2 [Rhizobium sp. CIAT894]MBB4299502.1 3-oxoacyl-[acyl-carrier protein] reductase [Rhizobium leguminosarum]MBB4310940.1 3-oxoacyl-[acyl-carrier protein] reductase [Rhizobium leguminosarum]MBB4419948.1 3-oxoacyl-[acyl-carrier protein] reductase [Rhizobium leguminosarum]MBB4435056.1 3-oxoacyl-[acyl-carrier protein] reductase [Rhizobium esperanzae]